jgi:hypothetical protein
MEEYIIYKISLLDNSDFCYIGSTKNYTIRKAKHKSDCLRHYPIKLYKMINENGGWDNCEMTPIDKIMVRDKIEARIREEELRIQHKANMNSNKAYIDEKNKKEELCIYNKKYVKDHYEHLQDLWKNQYEKNKSNILESRAKSYQYKKAWRELCCMEL